MGLFAKIADIFSGNAVNNADRATNKKSEILTAYEGSNFSFFPEREMDLAHAQRSQGWGGDLQIRDLSGVEIFDASSFESYVFREYAPIIIKVPVRDFDGMPSSSALHTWEDHVYFGVQRSDKQSISFQELTGKISAGSPFNLSVQTIAHNTLLAQLQRDHKFNAFLGCPDEPVIDFNQGAPSPFNIS
jgi:hypothetical protein